MAKLKKYNGSVQLMAGITQKGGDYALAEAHAIQVDEYGTRLDTELDNIKNRRADWNAGEDDPNYILNKPTILTETDVKEIIAKTGGGEGGNTVISVQADWNQTDSTKSDYIKNKPTLSTSFDEDTGVFKLEITNTNDA